MTTDQTLATHFASCWAQPLFRRSEASPAYGSDWIRDPSPGWRAPCFGM